MGGPVRSDRTAIRPMEQQVLEFTEEPDALEWGMSGPARRLIRCCHRRGAVVTTTTGNQAAGWHADPMACLSCAGTRARDGRSSPQSPRRPPQAAPASDDDDALPPGHPPTSSPPARPWLRGSAAPVRSRPCPACSPATAGHRDGHRLHGRGPTRRAAHPHPVRAPRSFTTTGAQVPSELGGAVEVAPNTLHVAFVQGKRLKRSQPVILAQGRKQSRLAIGRLKSER